MVQELWSFFANCPGTKIFASYLGTDTQNLELGTASTNNKWHLTIPWTRFCQYQCVSKSSLQYSTFAFFAKGLGTKCLQTVRRRILWLGPIGHTPKVNLQLPSESQPPASLRVVQYSTQIKRLWGPFWHFHISFSLFEMWYPYFKILNRDICIFF